ncbi:hypothetical protein [Desulfolutivibrio sulfoxidireducens]|uniref:hypothetical protein n=1 Tax=Desulfolutivibrio sulfoxidireducens TaxID=2773299 RepID=UPI00159D68C1|nr:hypothetical protein [Desulfolutivibrio sulfoxidireducens]
MLRFFRFAPALSILAMAVLLALSVQTAALAQQDKPAAAAKPEGQAIPDTPKKDMGVDGRRTPVAIEHGSTDVVGTRMVYHLKELLGRSSLMTLTTKDEKKLVLAIQTREEFTGRPAVSSIYSVAWLYSAKDGTLRYFLSAETGIVDAASLEQTVEAILAKTDKMAGTYGYLFQ